MLLGRIVVQYRSGVVRIIVARSDIVAGVGGIDDAFQLAFGVVGVDRVQIADGGLEFLAR
jgi:hypothetical protein